MADGLIKRLLTPFMALSEKEKCENEFKEKYSTLSTEELNRIIKEYESHPFIYRLVPPEREYIGYVVATEVLKRKKEEKD